jgi:alpha-galactosidase
MTRTAFVGAGSVEFTQALVGDMLSLPELADSTLVLHDRDPDRLALAEGVARAVAGAVGAPATIEAHADRRAALDGADFVICTIRVGGHSARVADFDVPGRHGLRQTMADTLGSGAIFHAARTIPVMVEIARDMSELCPDAWLLNYTNPMAMLVWGVYAGTSHERVVGLCPSIENTAEQLAERVGVPFDEVTFLGAGINHQAWLLRFERDGEDLYPQLDEALAADPDGIGRTARAELYRRFGRYPSESSEHTVDCVPYFLPHPGEVRRLRVWVDEYLERSRRNLGRVEEARDALAAGTAMEVTTDFEYSTRIIHSIVTGTPRTVYASVRNDDLITNLPRGCCVEVPCLVDGAGIQPTHIGDLPPQCAALNRIFASVCELVVRGVLEGREDHLRHAAMLDPATAAALTLPQIDALVADMRSSTAAAGVSP